MMPEYMNATECDQPLFDAISTIADDPEEVEVEFAVHAQWEVIQDDE